MIIVKIILFILGVIFLISIMNMSRAITNFLISLRISNMRNLKKSSSEIIQCTNDLLDLITFMINVEINNIMKSYYALNERYEMLHLDTDVSQISTSVYEGLSKDLISNKDLGITEDYILKYINNQTTLLFMSATQNYNKSMMTSMTT